MNIHIPTISEIKSLLDERERKLIKQIRKEVKRISRENIEEEAIKIKKEIMDELGLRN